MSTKTWKEPMPSVILTDFCVGFSNMLMSISTSLHQTAQDENKTDEQRSPMSVMPAVYDRTKVGRVI